MKISQIKLFEGFTEIYSSVPTPTLKGKYVQNLKINYFIDLMTAFKYESSKIERIIYRVEV